MTNEMTRSSQPREKPATRPTQTPMTVLTMVAITAISSDVRSPSSSRARLSSAVLGAMPSGWSQVKSPRGGPTMGVPVKSVTSTMSRAYLPSWVPEIWSSVVDQRGEDSRAGPAAAR